MVLFTPKETHVKQAFDLTGKVAIVTGGAGGIGLQIVRGLAEAGANVALLYRTAADADEKAAAVASETGVQVKTYKVDITDAEATESTVQQVVSDFGKLDIMVANAGIAAHYPAEDCTPDDFTYMMKVNLDGAFYCAQSAARAFKKQGNGNGNIIFTGSVSGQLVNIPQKQAAYNASKAALIHLSKSLAVEWIDFCRVNTISPGFIETEMLDMHPPETRAIWDVLVPAKRNCHAHELKGVYVFAASDASSYMTGANIIVDGGYVLP